MLWILIQPKYKFNVGFPLSLAHVATFLKEKTKEGVICFDCNLKSLKEIIDYIKKNKIRPDVFGMSCTEITEKNTLKMCIELKKEFPETKIILGGGFRKN